RCYGGSAVQGKPPIGRARLNHRPDQIGTMRYSALSLRTADCATFDQRVDLAAAVAELAEHLPGVLAELRRRAAQARLAALHADRRGDALVPVFGDHIAAVDGVLIGQRLVDLLHRAYGEAGGKQAIAERPGLVLREDGGEFLMQRLAVGNAVLVARKARIGTELGLA